VTSGAERLALLRGKFAQERVPSAGSLALTHRCNLRCVHCYLGNTREGTGRPELATARWLSLIDEIAEAGCIDLLLTGGEPLLRGDFAALYGKARRRGLLVSVFTNGTLVTREVVDLFRELPPQIVEVSLYGATEETCAAVTGARGALDRTLGGVRALLGAGVRVGLKTMLLSRNSGEFGDMERLAASLGVPFRADPAVFACLDGGCGPHGHRLDPAEAVALEFSDPQRAEGWRSHLSRTKSLPPAERLITCGAAVTGFHVDPSGLLTPCQLMQAPGWDLEKGAFADGWEGPMAELARREAPAGSPCRGCGKRYLCGICPALLDIERGEDPRLPPDYFCRLGEERRAALEGKVAPEARVSYNPPDTPP